MVDRFHFTGHTCCDVYNGDLHRDLDGDRSVAAEVINSVINKGATNISYLDGFNVIPFLKVLLECQRYGKTKDDVGRGDLEDEDVEGHVHTLFQCNCISCSTNTEDDPYHHGNRAIPRGWNCSTSTKKAKKF